MLQWVMDLAVEDGLRDFSGLLVSYSTAGRHPRQSPETPPQTLTRRSSQGVGGWAAVDKIELVVQNTGFWADARATGTCCRHSAFFCCVSHLGRGHRRRPSGLHACSWKCFPLAQYHDSTLSRDVALHQALVNQSATYLTYADHMQAKGVESQR